MSAPEHQGIRIGPSILSADFLHYGKSLQQAEEGNADYIHFDVMDGHFVPNISIGFPLLEATLRGTSLPVDVHLMIDNPDQWAPEFAAQGVAQVTFHAEATKHAHRVAASIVEREAMAGIAINPATPLDMVEEMLPFISSLLVMTINPGFGGQELIPETVGKVRRARQLIDTVNPACALQVDGGVAPDTIAMLHAAGADSFVAGSAVFNDECDAAANIKALRAAAMYR
ncbi:MAG: ribulose-phosphate 3-epimerase [Chloroflexota bacterium]|nr:ribulose-phosphate 3-epimerase [Chloroflexota bacterium]